MCKCRRWAAPQTVSYVVEQVEEMRSLRALEPSWGTSHPDEHIPETRLQEIWGYRCESGAHGKEQLARGCR